jgi:hypothetical protein
VSDVVRAFLGHLHEKKVALPKSMLQVIWRRVIWCRVIWRRVIWCRVIWCT